MGFLGYMAGGMLQGLGAGMAEKAKMDWQQRREIALENLRSQNNQAESLNTADLNDRNASRQVKRETDKALVIGNREAEITAARDDQLFKNEVQILGIKDSQAKANARLEYALRDANDAASQKRAAEITAGVRAGDFQIKEGGDGYYWKVFGDGREERSTFTVPPPSSGSGSSTVMDAVRQGQGPTKAPAPQQAAPSAKPSQPKLSAIPLVKTPDEARGLPKGTKFRTPDGRVFVR